MAFSTAALRSSHTHSPNLHTKQAMGETHTRSGCMSHTANHGDRWQLHVVDFVCCKESVPVTSACLQQHTLAGCRTAVWPGRTPRCQWWRGRCQTSCQTACLQSKSKTVKHSIGQTAGQTTPHGRGAEASCVRAAHEGSLHASSQGRLHRPSAALPCCCTARVQEQAPRPEPLTDGVEK
jgi:hypothetical protein